MVGISIGCNYTADATYTGAMVVSIFYSSLTFHECMLRTLLKQTNGQNNTQCNGLLSGNAGCGVIEWSRASYGPFFDSQGGGVFAMKWDENGIAICNLCSFVHSIEAMHLTTGYQGHFTEQLYPKTLSKGTQILLIGGRPLLSCYLTIAI